MSCNLKIASIVVVTLAIAFSSMSLVRLCSTFYEEQFAHDHKQVIDNGGIVPPTSKAKAEPWAAHATPVTKKLPSSTTPMLTATDKDPWSQWNKRKVTRTETIIAIIVSLVSILTSFMVFSAVSDDYDYNALKRHLVLPFVVFHSITTFFHAVAVCYLSVKYSRYMSALILPILVYTAMIFVTMIGISFVGSYYRCLSRMSGFKYAQMEDVVVPQDQNDADVKKPLEA